MKGNKASQLAFGLLFLCPLAPGLASATGKEVNAEIKLPLPNMQPVRVLDGDVRVALSLPEDLASSDLIVYTKRPSTRTIDPLLLFLPRECSETAYSRPTDLDSSTLTVHIRLASAFKRILPGIVRGLFPQTKLFHGREVPPHEVLATAEIRTWLLETSIDHIVYGLEILVILKFVDAEGKPLDTVEGVSTVQGRCCSNARCESLSTQAFKATLEQLVQKIKESEPLRLHLTRLAEARALPANLVTTVRFDDQTALLPNGRLDAGEEASLLVQVANSGLGPAYGVSVQVTSDRSQISVSGDGTVGDLDPGGKKGVELRVAGRLDLKAEIAKLHIDTAEKRGYGAQPVLLELATGQLFPPKLEFVDVALNDGSGRAIGDGDGQPSNGETIEAVVRIRNAGAGEAAGVSVTMASPKGIAEILKPNVVVLPRIAANGVGEARLLFRLPINLLASELSLAFQAVDARGAQVASTTKEATWTTRLKRPEILLAYPLYDGSSAGSLGNRDGKVNNGERIEVAVTPTNRGDLLARGVRIAVESDDSKLTPRPAVLEIGDLPAQTEGPVQRFVFDVPREYGFGRPAGDLHFSLTVSQQDFPPRREAVSFGFQALRPELAIEADAPALLVRGSSGEFVLRVRNAGSLRAEEVILEATSDATGVDLLDERGVPVRSLKIAFGALDPGSAASVSSLRINVRRNAGLGAAPVRLTLFQREFPSLAQTVQVPVIEEAASVSVAPRPEEPVMRGTPFPSAVPAAISFLEITEGKHFWEEESIDLSFEIQSSVELDDVRLNHKDRLIPLKEPHRSRASGLQMMRYTVPVKLEEGENRFLVVAVTREGLRSERPLVLFGDRKRGKLWVVAVGVSKYQDESIRPLDYADADAQAVYDYFRDTFPMKDAQVFLRINQQATLREIKSLLGTRLASLASDPRDTVVIYFAGHGMREYSPGSVDADALGKYFLPYDTSKSDLFSTALEMDELTNILRRLTADRVVIILDSCFSGAAGSRSIPGPKTREPIGGEFLVRMTNTGKGRVVLTASEPDQGAQEDSDLGHGVFTYYLLEGLRGAAAQDDNGDISVQAAFEYASKRLAQVTKSQQKPMKYELGGSVGKILIGHSAVLPGRR